MKAGRPLLPPSLLNTLRPIPLPPPSLSPLRLPASLLSFPPSLPLPFLPPLTSPLYFSFPRSPRHCSLLTKNLTTPWKLQ
ncbi:hypothetical protein E2C01_034827 [Portunus trituberculatus]|uniref:Uncharacterized protein n=1 Tax=Portunus trituberculatus TaxID=210409 RepID=A0A5B7F1K6_PORTR|nr:hypothetical protein [Portunus trituberculatus]